MQGKIPETLIAELARIFEHRAPVRDLLEAAGLVPGRLPPFGELAPEAYWRAVCRELGAGLARGGLLRLVRAALAAYPDNRVFQGANAQLAASEVGDDELASDGNPFAPWTPATPPRFFGRREELRSLGAALDEGRSVSVVGDWRIGKTSLLATWRERAEAAGRTAVLVSGEKGAGASVQGFVEAVTGRQMASPSVDLSADAAADVLAEWCASALAGLPPVLLVDELDGMVKRFDLRFFERLRGMLGRIVLVLASRRDVDRLYEDDGRASPFANRLELLRLGLLEEDATSEVIGLGRRWFEEEDVKLMRRWSGQHPFYLQLLGRRLVEAVQRGTERQVALERFRDEASGRLRELWSRFSRREQSTLLAGALGKKTLSSTLVRRGVVSSQGGIFGEVLLAWLRDEFL